MVKMKTKSSEAFVEVVDDVDDKCTVRDGLVEVTEVLHHVLVVPAILRNREIEQHSRLAVKKGVRQRRFTGVDVGGSSIRSGHNRHVLMSSTVEGSLKTRISRIMVLPSESNVTFSLLDVGKSSVAGEEHCMLGIKRRDVDNSGARSVRIISGINHHGAAAHQEKEACTRSKRRKKI
ncbi:hypothetical protein GUJ93_ZPchr0002g24124 [Zizania palustris]|uniref:Uncharacterized protein n=1 Tax=Zizania palustris TaxID=103762 RepID=A0A8J5VCB3_ZIZPA|nr:hypothetical protein GUJ93_ZPchr0002g24124 [Zizania palustris]